MSKDSEQGSIVYALSFSEFNRPVKVRPTVTLPLCSVLSNLIRSGSHVSLSYLTIPQGSLVHFSSLLTFLSSMRLVSERERG